MTLLSTIQAKVGERLNSSMYVETEFWGKKVQVMMNTRVSTVCMVKEMVDKIDLLCQMIKGYIKNINEKSLPIYGVALCVDIQIRLSRGKIYYKYHTPR